MDVILTVLSTLLQFFFLFCKSPFFDHVPAYGANVETRNFFLNANAKKRPQLQKLQKLKLQKIKLHNYKK